MDVCGKCGETVPVAARDCLVCGTHHGFPNVKVARAEGEELEARYSAAREGARQRGCVAQLNELEVAMNGSHAVVNVDSDFLYRLLTSEQTLYASYAKQTAAGTRASARLEQDQQRTAVEGLLFGSWGKDLCYAALALDGCGLASYGDASIELRDAAIEDRASALEDNSYQFVQRHRLVPGDPLPLGYRATWQTRARLAVAKLASRLEATTTPGEHPSLLLTAGEQRSDDQFVEIHVFGSFNREAIAAVRVLITPEDPGEQVLLAAARAKAAKLGVRWP